MQSHHRLCTVLPSSLCRMCHFYPKTWRDCQERSPRLPEWSLTCNIIEIWVLCYFFAGVGTPMYFCCASNFGLHTQAILRNSFWPVESTIVSRYLHILLWIRKEYYRNIYIKNFNIHMNQSTTNIFVNNIVLYS